MADGVLSTAVVEELATRVERARAGQLSIYGLFCLIEDLEPVPQTLLKAQQRRDQGLHHHLTAGSQALLASEQVFENAEKELRRILKDDLDRALQLEGVTIREQKRALSFIEAQLQDAAKDISATGEKRRQALKEKRCQLEHCAVVEESKAANVAEQKVATLTKKYEPVRKEYEAWQAGKHKFKTNDVLQAARRTYEDLKKQIATARVELEDVLRQRRPGGSSPVSAASRAGNGCGGRAEDPKGAGAVGSWQTPRAGGRASAWQNATVLERKVVQVTAENSKDEGQGRTRRARFEEGAPEVAVCAAAPKSRQAAEDDDIEDAFRQRMPARQAKQKCKGQAFRDGDARFRGMQVLAQLGAEINHRSHSDYQGAEEPQRGASAAQAARREAWPSQAAEEEEEEAEGDESEAGEPDSQEGEHELPDGWEAVWSEPHDAYYYWNTETDEVQWEPPPPPPRPSSRAAAAGGAAAAAPAAARRRAVDNNPEVDERAGGRDGVHTGGGGTLGSRARSEPETVDGDRGTGADGGQKLSYGCVVVAVARELGLPEAEVRDLGISTVDEWRANFGPKEWERVRSRALALEGAKREAAQKAEKARESRSLSQITYENETKDLEKARRAANHVDMLMPLRSRAGAAAPARPAARQPPQQSQPAAAPAAGRGRAQGGRGAPKGQGGPPRGKIPGQAVADLAHRNRFAGMGDSDSD